MGEKRIKKIKKKKTLITIVAFELTCLFLVLLSPACPLSDRETNERKIQKRESRER